MALSIQTNYANLVGQNTINKTNSDFNTSLERLSTGFRINSAADDAAGLQISNRLEAQGRGMGVAMRNANDAISQMQAAEGALEQMTDIAYRMNDLATQAANGTASDEDRETMQAEFSSLNEELTSMVENTNFGGQNLLDATGVFSSGSVTYQVGNTSAETLSVDVATQIGDVTSAIANETEATAYAAGQTAVTDAEDALTALQDSYDADIAGAADQAAIDAIDAAIVTAEDNVTTASDALAALPTGTLGDISTAAGATAAMDLLSGTGGSSFIDQIGAARSSLGANINRLDYTVANLASMQENTAAAKSNIMDTDMASESSAMSKNQMLMQMGTQMLSTTKMVPQLAMGLLG